MTQPRIAMSLKMIPSIELLCGALFSTSLVVLKLLSDRYLILHKSLRLPRLFKSSSILNLRPTSEVPFGGALVGFLHSEDRTQAAASNVSYLVSLTVRFVDELFTHLILFDKLQELCIALKLS
jgi:hypothetical protein